MRSIVVTTQFVRWKDNQSIFDVYVDGSLWQSYDGYAADPGEVTRTIPLTSNGPHLFELRNRPEKNRASSGYTVRFKQLVSADIGYDLHTITYQYDALSRLLNASYYPGNNLTVDPTNSFAYAYDVAGNRLSETINSGTPTTYGYNEANQINNTGFSYDPNGNLLNDGVNSYTWDRANRLLSMGGLNYKYDGAGNRIEQSNGVDITKYLLDLQPSLALVSG